ncbi:MAG: protein-L-isoaspartate O-methyltransferase [Gammaproteobacteria bacterium]|nr:protein-L-isoaspartate O-methyltransferase [Gammaproteobacteria bacterium]
MNIEQARFNMIEQQVRPWDVLDQQVLDQIARIPREEFVPKALRSVAFSDTALPIGNGQLMMEPKQEARLLQALALQPGDKVLEIGTGSGYLTALLASQAARVISVEIDDELLAQAREHLAAQGIANVELLEGNAARGWDAEQPYDAIAVTGSLPSIPTSLKENMQIGGRMFVVVGRAPMMQAMLVTRLNIKEWQELPLFETLLAPLQSDAGRTDFVF